jgi:hypothetical protein
MTGTPLIHAVSQLRFPDVRWTERDKPVLIADGVLHRIGDLKAIVAADRAYVVGVNQKSFDHLMRFLRATTVHFYEMRVADLAAIAQLGDVQALAISWNTKVVSLDPLAALPNVSILSFDDTPKVRDLAPIARLTRLRALQFSGGIWNKNTADSLEPLAALDELEELSLLNLRVLDGGLRPLGRLPSLRRLDVSNQFDTADYAYLSVALRQTDCDHFAPYIPLGAGFGGKDVMVVGAGKPFLDSTADAARLRRYVEAFETLQAGFVADT